MSPGYEFVALDGLRIDIAGCEARTRRYRPGDKSEVTVFRGDELITLRMKWQEAPADTCFLAMADEDNAASNRLLDKLGFQFAGMVTMPGETEEIRQYLIETG